MIRPMGRQNFPDMQSQFMMSIIIIIIIILIIIKSRRSGARAVFSVCI